MTASDRTTRRTDEAERARHGATSEAAAFATTAGTMLLGILAGAEVSHGRDEPQPPALTTRPPGASLQPTETAPAAPPPTDHRPPLDDRHADTNEVPAVAPTPTIAADAEASLATTPIDASPDAQAAAQTLMSSAPAQALSAPAEASSTDAGAGVGGSAAPRTEFEAPASQLVTSDPEVADATLATVTQTIANVSASVEQLTSSVSGAVSELVGGLSGLVANLTHQAPGTGAAEAPPALIAGPVPASAEASTAEHHVASLLDTAGTVPMTWLQPLPLQLGFLGQPTSDGHETHDGAFSALGVHHF